MFNPPRVIGYVTKDEPGTEIVADGAATLAAAVALLGDEDPEWKANAMKHAVELYEFGKKYPRSYSDSSDPGISILNEMYESNNGFEDDMAWAALWLYKATGKTPLG
jgi:endoglucanase